VTKDVNLEIIICGAQKGRNENTNENIQEKISHAGELGGGEEGDKSIRWKQGGKEYSQPTEYKGRNRSRCRKKVRERGTSQDSKKK
jgi:hypothetical protein